MLACDSSMKVNRYEFKPHWAVLRNRCAENKYDVIRAFGLRIIGDELEYDGTGIFNPVGTVKWVPFVYLMYDCENDFKGGKERISNFLDTWGYGGLYNVWFLLNEETGKFEREPNLVYRPMEE